MKIRRCCLGARRDESFAASDETGGQENPGEERSNRKLSRQQCHDGEDGGGERDPRRASGPKSKAEAVHSRLKLLSIPAPTSSTYPAIPRHPPVLLCCCVPCTTAVQCVCPTPSVRPDSQVYSTPCLRRNPLTLGIDLAVTTEIIEQQRGQLSHTTMRWRRVRHQGCTSTPQRSTSSWRSLGRCRCADWRPSASFARDKRSQLTSGVGAEKR